MNFSNAQNKVAFVNHIFRHIAPVYARMNRIMTFGQDTRWRKRVVSLLGPENGRIYLDAGAGTGEIASLIRKAAPGSVVVAADLTREMLTEGITKKDHDGILWVQADAQALPFSSSSFDGLTSGYLLRNVPDINIALSEQARVLRSDRVCVSLDTTPPERGILRPFIRFYLNTIIPILGRIIAAQPEAYYYLPASTQCHATCEELAGSFSRNGFLDVRYEKWMAGTMAIHFARKL